MTRRASTFVLAALALALPCLAPAAARAQSTADEKDFFVLEDHLVTVATKRAVPMTEAPAIVTVITAEDIRQHGYRTVAEALRWVPGFYELDDFTFANFGVRGVNAGPRGASRILKVMVDGQPTAFRSTQANFLNQELIPMQAVEKIEVVRGPGSALYGANAFLGVVNVLTKRGKDLHGGIVAASGEYVEGTHNFGGGGEVVAGGELGKLDAMATGSYFRLDRSGAALPDTSPLFTAQRLANRLETVDDLARPASFYSRTTYDADALGRFTVHGGFQRLDSPTQLQDLGPLPYVGTPPDTKPVETRQVLDNGFVRLLHELKPTESIDTTLSFAYAAGGPDADDRFDTGQPSTFYRRRYGYQSFDFTGQVGWQAVEQVHVSLGVDHTVDDHQLLTYSSEARDTGATIELEPKAKKTFNNTGLYAQGIVKPIERIELTGGVRLDLNSYYGSQVTGRGAAVVKLTDDVSAKLLYGSSFQAPSPELLFGQISQPGDIVGNPDLKPQRADFYEAQIGFRRDWFGVSANTYYNKTRDLAQFVPFGNQLRAENVADLESYGVEAETSLRLGDLAAHGSVAYERTLLGDRGQRQPLNIFPSREQSFPRWIVAFGPSYKIPVAPIVVAWDNMWVDSRRASKSNANLNRQPYELDAYFLSNLTISTTNVKLTEGLEGFAVAQVIDLFNERPFDPGFGGFEGNSGIDYPSLGRRYVLTLGVRF